MMLSELREGQWYSVQDPNGLVGFSFVGCFKQWLALPDRPHTPLFEQSDSPLLLTCDMKATVEPAPPPPVTDHIINPGELS